MKRWMRLVALAALLIVALTACGGGDDGDGDTPSQGGDTPVAADSAPTVRPTPSGPTPTPRSPALRANPTPVVDSQTFEAPFSVGSFVRQSLDGRADTAALGGQRAFYTVEGASALLTVMELESTERAIATVRSALEGGAFTRYITPPFYEETTAYGIGVTRDGYYLAIWSNRQWYYQVQVIGDEAQLNDFLELFPY